MLSAMDLRTQRDYIRWRGPELARSGYFRNWFEVACQLRYEGAYCAHAEMNPFRREQLSRLCVEAKPTDDGEHAVQDTTIESLDESAAILFWLPSEIASLPPNFIAELDATSPPEPNVRFFWDFRDAVTNAIDEIARSAGGKVPWIKVANKIMGPREVAKEYSRLKGNSNA